MKYIFSKTLLTLTLFSSLSQASGDAMYSFLGLQVSSSEYEDISTETVAIKYGQQSAMWRTAISYNFAQNSDDKMQSLVAQIDHGILTEMFETLPVKPYIGFSIGVMEHKNNMNAVSTDRGYLYGLNGGINYVINDKVDIDLGYRYMKTTNLESIDKVSDAMLSLHYYFQ